MSARENIAATLWWGVAAPTIEEAKAGAERMLDAYRAEVLAEAIAAVEDREQRRAAHGGDVFGWESARAVLGRMRRLAAKTEGEQP